MSADKNQNPSMSDIILDFASPMISEGMPAEAIQSTLNFCMIVWNIPLLPADKAAQYRTNLLNSMPHDGTRSALMWANTIEQMLARRRVLYPNDRRLLTSVQLVNRKGRVDIQTDYQIAEGPTAAA
jgi:hypothetical protein